MYGKTMIQSKIENELALQYVICTNIMNIISNFT